MHAAIIEAELWDRVQAKLIAAGARPRGRSPISIDARILTGILRDETGDQLTPTHTRKEGRRFAYYVSNRLIAGGKDPSGWRLPAEALEATLRQVIVGHLRTTAIGHAFLVQPEAGGAAELVRRVPYAPSACTSPRQTTYFGEQNGPWMVRVQNKVADRRTCNAKRVLLGREKRARIEVTLDRLELRRLGLISLSRLFRFRFAKLQGRFFHFALPTFLDEPDLPQHAAIAAEVNRTDRECFRQGGVVCLERWRRLKEQWLSAKPRATTVKQSPLQRLREDVRVLGGKVQYRRAGTGRYGATIAYSELNEMVSSALRDLDRRTRS